MKKLLICCLLITNIILGQNTNDANILLQSIYAQLINNDGSLINFEYLFENDAHAMKDPINGTIGLFSENRFYLEFTPSKQNKVIQIYNGEALFTIIPKDKEIQIESLDPSESIFIQDIFHNYESDFEVNIKGEKNEQTTIELKPKIQYNDMVFNNCIDQLELPNCFKLPDQCKIGIRSDQKMKLEICLEENGGYIENNILKIELAINTKKMSLESITQLNRYNGKTSIQIKSIKKGNPKMLNIKNLPYQNFEIIDLR